MMESSSRDTTSRTGRSTSPQEARQTAWWRFLAAYREYRATPTPGLLRAALEEKEHYNSLVRAGCWDQGPAGLIGERVRTRA